MKIKTALRTVRRLAMAKNMEHIAEMIQMDGLHVISETLKKSVAAEEKSLAVLDILIERIPMEDDFILLTKDGARHSLNPRAFYHNGMWREEPDRENDKRTKDSNRKSNTAA